MQRPVLEPSSARPVELFVLQAFYCPIELSELSLHVEDLCFHLLDFLVLALKLLMILLLLLLELCLHVIELNILGLEAGEAERAKPLEKLFKLELLAVKALHLLLSGLELPSDLLE